MSTSLPTALDPVSFSVMPVTTQPMFVLIRNTMRGYSGSRIDHTSIAVWLGDPSLVEVHNEVTHARRSPPGFTWIPTAPEASGPESTGCAMRLVEVIEPSDSSLRGSSFIKLNLVPYVAEGDHQGKVQMGFL